MRYISHEATIKYEDYMTATNGEGGSNRGSREYWNRYRVDLSLAQDTTASSPDSIAMVKRESTGLRALQGRTVE